MIKLKGFTLIELLVVIGILGILVLIGIPAFRNYQPGMQLSSAVQELVTDIRYTGQLAVTEQFNHGIRFFPFDDKYQIIRYEPEEKILASKNLPEKVSFQQITGFTEEQVIFNSYGAVQESGLITLVNTKNATTTIDVRPSGFVRIIK